MRMENKHTKRLEQLRRLAEDHPGHSGAKVVAAIYYGGQFFYGFNSEKTHPLQAKFAKNKHAIQLHAEIDAIRNALRYLSVEQLSRTALYVARVKRPWPRSDMYINGLAKPCSGCAACIAHFCIPKIFYTGETT